MRMNPNDPIAAHRDIDDDPKVQEYIIRELDGPMDKEKKRLRGGE